VLHLGCTNWPYGETALADGSLLHLQLGRVARELHGLDADAVGLQRLSERGIPKLHVGDLEALDSTALPTDLDVIVAGEVIEHLSNPGRFLAGVRNLMGPSTTLLITTVNAYCAFRGAQYALRSRGGVLEPVHPDHVAYYSYATLTRLVERAGFVVDAVHFYDIGVEHLPYAPAHVRWFNAAAVWAAPHLADGLIVECRKQS
jgi:cyclopropane fatty-acyl-phospholipid synthase-like methyltransferase